MFLFECTVVALVRSIKYDLADKLRVLFAGAKSVTFSKHSLKSQTCLLKHTNTRTNVTTHWINCNTKPTIRHTEEQKKFTDSIAYNLLVYRMDCDSIMKFCEASLAKMCAEWIGCSRDKYKFRIFVSILKISSAFWYIYIC